MAVPSTIRGLVTREPVTSVFTLISPAGAGMYFAAAVGSGAAISGCAYGAVSAAFCPGVQAASARQATMAVLVMTSLPRPATLGASPALCKLLPTERDFHPSPKSRPNLASDGRMTGEHLPRIAMEPRS